VQTRAPKINTALTINRANQWEITEFSHVSSLTSLSFVCHKCRNDLLVSKSHACKFLKC